MLIRPGAIAIAGVLSLNALWLGSRAWPTFIMIRGDSLDRPVSVWHSPIPMTKGRTSALSLLYESVLGSEVPCSMTRTGIRYEVAEYWYIRDTKDPVGSRPPRGHGYHPAYRVAVIDVQGTQYCWVGAERGATPVPVGKAGKVVPAVAVKVLREAGIP